jgi:hypothetical protein
MNKKQVPYTFEKFLHPRGRSKSKREIPTDRQKSFSIRNTKVVSNNLVSEKNESIIVLTNFFPRRSRTNATS